MHDVKIFLYLVGCFFHFLDNQTFLFYIVCSKEKYLYDLCGFSVWKIYGNFGIRTFMRERGNKKLRLLDIYLGKMLIAFFSLFKWKRRELPQEIASIGILKGSGIGDLTLMSGVIFDIKRQFPNAKVFLFCPNALLPLTPMLRGIDSVEVFSFSKPFKAIKKLRAKHLSILLDFGQWSRIEALLTHLSKARYTVGFRSNGQFRHHLYDKAIFHSDKVHEVENFRSLISMFPRASISSPTLASVVNVDVKEKRFTLFHPWAVGHMSEMREWPESHWVELAIELSGEYDHIYISGSPCQRKHSQALAEKINHSVGTSFATSVAGKFSLSELYSLMEKASLIVSINTGIMHMAACTNAALIALHGPTSISRWGPYRKQNVVSLSPQGDLAEYLHLGFEYPMEASYVMDKLSVTSVVKKIEGLHLFSH